MEIQVYIAQLKDEKFDYNIENPKGDQQYAPKPISSSVTIRNLYKDIVYKVLEHHENTKMTDWGTFVIKFTNIALINFLSNKGYENDLWKLNNNVSLDINTLINYAKNLTDGEYLLVAQELW
jgi:hypothetical protein